jgi:hypothetical protein
MSRQLPAQRQIDCRDFPGGSAFWQKLFAAHCDIRRDHDALVACASMNDEDFASHFDALRRMYPDRLEYPRFNLAIDAATQPAGQLRQLGFQLAP